MANHASAQKRNRQRLVRTQRNKGVRSALKTVLKRARVAIDGGDAIAAKDPVLLASKALARAAKKGVIHPRTASRKTARINAAAAKLTAQN